MQCPIVSDCTCIIIMIFQKLQHSGASKEVVGLNIDIGVLLFVVGDPVDNFMKYMLKFQVYFTSIIIII